MIAADPAQIRLKSGSSRPTTYFCKRKHNMRFLLAAILALLSLRADAFIQHGEFANTFVNTPLAPNAPLDPNSAAIVAELIHNTPSGWVVNVSGVPIYFVDETVPTVQIRGPEGVYMVPVERQLSAVPLP